MTTEAASPYDFTDEEREALDHVHALIDRVTLWTKMELPGVGMHVVGSIQDEEDENVTHPVLVLATDELMDVLKPPPGMSLITPETKETVGDDKG